MLLEREAAAGDGDVVIGGEQGDQAEYKAADGLGKAQPVEGPAALGFVHSGGIGGAEQRSPGMSATKTALCIAPLVTLTRFPKALSRTRPCR